MKKLSLEERWGMICTASEEEVNVHTSGFSFSLKILHERALSTLTSQGLCFLLFPAVQLKSIYNLLWNRIYFVLWWHPGMSYLISFHPFLVQVCLASIAFGSIGFSFLSYWIGRVIEFKSDCASSMYHKSSILLISG